MNELAKFEGQKKKLQGLCDEHNLVFRFKAGQYPITLTIRPMNGVGEQMQMLAMAEENGYTSPDAFIIFAFEDGEIEIGTAERFSIGDDLFSKIKNIFKKMVNFYVQHFYRDIIGKGVLSAKTMPVIDTDSDSDGTAKGSADKAPDASAAAEDSESDSDAEDGDGADGNDDDDAEAAEDEEDEGDGLPESRESFSEQDPEGQEEAKTGDANEDSTINEAVVIVRQAGKATVGLLQRSLKIGYARAARLMDKLEELGVVGPYTGAAAREVLPLPEASGSDYSYEEVDRDAD